jgi:hypothetical protein
VRHPVSGAPAAGDLIGQVLRAFTLFAAIEKPVSYITIKARISVPIKTTMAAAMRARKKLGT